MWTQDQYSALEVRDGHPIFMTADGTSALYVQGLRFFIPFDLFEEFVLHLKRGAFRAFARPDGTVLTHGIRSGLV